MLFDKVAAFQSRQAGEIFAKLCAYENKDSINYHDTPIFSVCLASGPKAQAVVPPPDGGYPNFTTAEGQNALFNLTTGSANTAVGWFSLFGNTTGSFNTATGAGSLLFNTGDSNTAFGAAALFIQHRRC